MAKLTGAQRSAQNALNRGITQTHQKYDPKTGIKTVTKVGTAPTTDMNPNVTLEAPKPVKGVFTNATTGAYTDRYGNAVDASGNKIVEQQPEQLATYGEIGEANIQADYNANLDAELGLTGEQTGYTSLDEYYQDLYNANKEQTGLSKEQYDLQKQQIGETASDNRNIIEGQVESASGLVGSREGVTSTSNVSAYNRLKEVAGTQIQRLQQAQDMSIKTIEQAKKDLDRALRSGNTELANQYRQTLLSAESQAQATETSLVNALTLASEEERNVQAQKNANIASFTDIVDSGTDMSVETISNFAKNLGVDFDTAYGYYAGSQAIRDDKSLDLETKQIELDNLKYDFNNKLAGIAGEEAQNINNYLKLVKSGRYSEEELAMYATSMGIPNEKNPVYQADLAVKQAEAKIKQQEANGQLVNPLDQIDLAQKRAEYYDYLGITPGAIPTGGGTVETTAVQTGNGIQFQFTDNSTISSADRTLTQCGQFVNDVMGLSMGDSYESKMAYVDKNIVMPEPGMAFVHPVSGPYAPNGHTGIVESFDPVTGMVNVADVNSDGKETAKHHQIPLATILNGGGFVPATGTPLENGSMQSSILLQVPDVARTAVTTKANQFDGEQNVKSFQTVQEGYNFLSGLNTEDLTSADNQAIIYAFAKIMDPNSVVRESEYETVQRYAQSLAQTYGFNAQRILANTEFLSKEAVDNMINTVQSRYDSSAQSYNKIRDEYIRTINNMAGSDVGDSLLQNYTVDNQISKEEDTEVQDLIELYDNSNMLNEFEGIWGE